LASGMKAGDASSETGGFPRFEVAREKRAEKIEVILRL
jgi:hypothetical protein